RTRSASRATTCWWPSIEGPVAGSRAGPWAGRPRQSRPSAGARRYRVGRMPLGLEPADEPVDDGAQAVHPVPGLPAPRQLMGFAGEAQELGLDALPAQGHVPLLALLDQAAVVFLAVDHQGRGAHAAHVGNGRLPQVVLGVFPGRLAGAPDAVPPVPAVAGPEEGVAVGDRPHDAGCLEAVRVARDPGGHVAAVGAAGDAQALRVDPGEAGQGGVDPRHQVRIVVGAPVAADAGTEVLAVALAAPGIGVDDGDAG